MSLKKVSLVFLAAIAAPALWADISWDFSSGQGSQGWTAKDLTWSSSGGWGDEVTLTASGWQNSTNGSTSIENGRLGSTGYYAQAPISGDLSTYIGGTLSLTLTDVDVNSGSFPVFGPNGGAYTTDGESTFPHVTNCFPYVFMSGQVNGEWVLVGHHVQFSSETRTYSISLDNNDWVPFDIKVISSGLPGGNTNISISTAGVLSGEVFAELMTNSDGIFVRTESNSSGSVGGSDPVPVTGIDSMALIAIPEPSSYAMAGILGSIGLLIAARCRKNR
ncbi:MAG: hypothetical protein LBV12_07715 [Puniceicoccales bacterium]|jgi:hypothetical protein|nr:hypothetical protein [Puniceicoccales bacterium]